MTTLSSAVKEFTSASVPTSKIPAVVSVAVMKRHGFTKSFTEHGVIIGMVS